MHLPASTQRPETPLRQLHRKIGFLVSRGVRQRPIRYILKKHSPIRPWVPTNALSINCDPRSPFFDRCLFSPERSNGFHHIFQVDVRRVARFGFTDHPLSGYRDSYPGFHAGAHPEVERNRGTQQTGDGVGGSATIRRFPDATARHFVYQLNSRRKFDHGCMNRNKDSGQDRTDYVLSTPSDALPCMKAAKAAQ